MPRQQRVFLSYAHENLDTVKTLYDDLKKREVNVWFDKIDLGKGTWKKQIRKAITQSTDFLICISQATLRKTGDTPGYQDEELDYAYRIAIDETNTEFTIIPVRLEDCGRGDYRLRHWHQYDLFEDRNGELDRLAVECGGYSLADKQAKDERTEDEKMIERLYGKIEAFFYADEHKKALRTLNAVADLEEEATGAASARTWYKKGASLWKLHRYDEAVAAYDKALDIAPDFALPWFKKGEVLEKLKRRDEALAAYDQVLAIAPDFAPAWFKKGKVLMKLLRYDKALVAFENVLDLYPNHAQALDAKQYVLKQLRRTD